MRRKPVPPAPDSLDRLWDAHRAVPLIPGSEDDCCGRVAERLDVTPDEGRDWLVFCQSLGLAREVSRGFERVRGDRQKEELRTAFVEHVFGAQEVLDALGDDPRSADDVFEAFEPTVPNWERHRDPEGWESRWRDRVARLLDWAVLFGVAAQKDGGYVAVDA
ncbi:hypothetical protein E6P09_13780 [Haloferax mediterranei ATCC 33500]|uniref:Uncharacterized protein n=1 Tax=Haloferax mediterranei (strain ATCC 33500 / DSM 1411 / JCM 8866 / NBRC 14739 / NCIMB 2177 / R-4) TaxID=523841 RepID=I3R7R8_HALMT|nr:hypothetical protein [Haloferax mediterranei]AFK20278.1 hypothetical protein HFX_2600 [Haloferax mediterranei ATCC 33500]AHZ23647.1 hypothetical protein BM92_13805 [Haloferax mediterranei ATCC 33500]ELZ99134.1 hypothetical protein C439_14784 [Haloferax mediterranei ATCC 33500]MDX5986968.1 hypothetical protein [Haloferax mediterranei ATCC 33500]QCQ76286.1 hypothetical protein E6P09_13780 [Haloferax mediterranei ATCC 33500]